MNRRPVAWLALPVLIGFACAAPTAPKPPDSTRPTGGTGGSRSTGGAGGSATGGAQGGGGSSGVDVAPGTGGSGGTGTGGSGGTGGTGTGGTAGSGGTGGTGTGGTGGTAGTGGTPGTGGRDAGGTRDSTGGTGGMGGTGGTPGSLCTGGDCRAVVGMLDGYLIEEGCSGPRMGSDCIGTWCASGMKLQTRDFKLVGPAADPTKTFEVSLRIRGVAECKSYSGGMRRVAAHQGKGELHDQWYVGGTPVGITSGNPWNSQELHVTPPVAGEANAYYMNSCGMGQGESHFVYKLDYMAKIKMRGGGNLNYRKVDNNCRMIANCGTEESGTGSCAMSHSVELGGSVPPPPSTFSQPLTNAQGARGQFIFIDVLDVKGL